MKLTYKNTLHACYLGYVTQAIVNNLAPLLYIIFQDQYTVSFEQIGRLALINFVTQLIVDVISVRAVDKVGYRKAAVFAHAFSVLGLICLAALPNLLPDAYVGLVISVMLYAIGGGLLEVIVSPIVDSLPGDDNASAMSLLHSFYSWGQMAVILLTTFLLRFMGSSLWTLLPLLWALVPLFNLFAFLKVPLMPTVPEEHKTPLKTLLSSRFFMIAMLIMLCAGASEMTMVQWASLFAEKGLGVSKVVGDLAGPCLFALLMGLGRTAYGIWGNRVKIERMLVMSSGLCILCYLLAAFAPHPFFSLMGCAFCGLSIALMWPGTLSMSAARFPMGGTAMFGVLAIFGDLGCSVGPWLTGLVSDLIMKNPAFVEMANSAQVTLEQVGLKGGLTVGVVFPTILLVCLGVAHLQKKRAEKLEDLLPLDKA
ncbi:MAG: MFS transporter [Christensenellales bacterium]|jgi:fucose permease